MNSTDDFVPGLVKTKRQKVEEGYNAFWSFNTDLRLDANGPSDASSLSLPFFHAPQTSTIENFNRDVDQLLASEMYNLSVKERDQVYDDVHGTSQETKETTEFVDALLEELSSELGSIPQNQRLAYTIAEVRWPNFVQDRKFRLMFLRAKNYDPKEAANQIVKHFEVKRQLFGVELLGKNIEQSDLEEADQPALLAGGMQVLRRKDTSGRSIYVYMYHEVVGTLKKFAVSSFII